MARIKDGMSVAKLPVWAQEYIKDLECERELTLRTLNTYVQEQEPSPIFVDEHPITGEGPGIVRKRMYVKSRHIEIVHGGVRARISCDNDGPRNDTAIKIVFWDADGRASSGGVCMVPTGFGEVSLMSKENLRD